MTAILESIRDLHRHAQARGEEVEVLQPDVQGQGQALHELRGHRTITSHFARTHLRGLIV